MATASFAILAWLVLFIVVPLAVLVTVAVVALRSTRRGRSGVSSSDVALRDAPAAYRRAVSHARATAWASWALLVGASVAVGLIASVIPGGFEPEGYGAPTAAAGLVFLAACAVGELTWPHPAGPVRRAPLQVRTVETIAPAPLRRLVWLWAGLLVVTLVVTGLTSSGGTELTLRFGAYATSTASPYPGWRYGIPIMAAALVVVAACEVVLRLVARRPAVADTAPQDDHRLRRVSARRVLAAVQLVLAITAATVLAVTANSARIVGWARVGPSTALLSTETPSVNVGAAVLGVVAGVLAVVVLVTGVVVTVDALTRAATEAGQPVTPPPASAGGIEPAGAPS